ncbi:hypothetical protein GCK72_023764 [Caenorhabditis remanei]|uniref:Uncharacterized protein n=1 Tax=Caenorhabditis remanei TaxID=31234 RepID=A0A6A5FXQ6_CAERE|nr:hypothetical protein GCK72_023764 [Caenorhabditis remanei]KAF1747302.1 hypothetical protein GCK72_023764 [Caenorhabditis remanei]
MDFGVNGMFPMFQNPLPWPAIPFTPLAFTQPNLVLPPVPSSSNASGILSSSNTEMNGGISSLLDQFKNWSLNEQSTGLQQNPQMPVFHTPPTTPIEALGLVSSLNNGALNVTPHVLAQQFNILLPMINPCFFNLYGFGMGNQIQQFNSTLMTPPSTCSPGSQMESFHSFQETASPIELFNQNPILHNQRSQCEASNSGMLFRMQEDVRASNQEKFPFMAAMTVNSSTLKIDVNKTPKKFGGYGRKHKYAIMDKNDDETDKLRLDHYCCTWEGVKELSFVINEVRDHLRLKRIRYGDFSILLNAPIPGVTAIEAAKWFHQFMRHRENIPGFSFLTPDKKMIFEPGCQNKTGGKAFYNEKRVDDVLAAMEGTVNTKTYEKQARKTRQKRSQQMQNRYY